MNAEELAIDPVAAAHRLLGATIAGRGVRAMAAVLLRAAAIEDGAELATSRRGQTVRAVALARGPGNLCAALGITMADNGIDLFDPSSPVRLRLNDTHRARSGPRVGVSQAADRPWRLWLTGRPEVSAYRRSSRAPARGASD